MQLTRTHRILIGVVVAGAVVIAAIGFAGSYAAVRKLAQEKGFGNFSLVFPIGIDAGICVLLALDLLLTWIRIPFPLLRQSAWILTTATIAFNGAAAWPDPLGVGMHAVIPLLFIVTVEAARHAVGRMADITADKHMEGVRLTRWLLSPIPTFKLWRRMKLWELRSYEQVIRLEQDRLIYQSRLQARFGRNWRRKAPIESMMPLRLAKYGVPLADTAAGGLAAAGIDPMVLPPAPAGLPQVQAEIANGPFRHQIPGQEQVQQEPLQQPAEPQVQVQAPGQVQVQAEAQPPAPAATGPAAPQPAAAPAQDNPPQEPATPAVSPWFAAPVVAPEGTYEGAYNPVYVDGQDPTPVMVPSGPGGRTRPLGGAPGGAPGQEQPAQQYAEAGPDGQILPDGRVNGVPVSGQEPEELPVPGLPDEVSRLELYFNAFKKYVSEHNEFPNGRQFAKYLQELYGITGRTGGPLSENSLRGYLRDFGRRYQTELDADAAEHIA
jgi:hypothetical protein